MPKSQHWRHIEAVGERADYADAVAAETSQTLDRGIRVLRALAEAPGGLTMTELATSLAVNRTVAYRLVATLEAHALVRRDRAGRLHVGLGVLHLTAGLQPQLRAVATPVLRRLADDTGCTAHLTVADGDEALALAVVEPSWTDFHVAYRIGSRHRLDAGAAGRAILLGRTGEAGEYAVTTGELQTGATGLAAPVPGVAGWEASVGIVTLGPLDVERIAPEVTRAAHELATHLT